MMKTYVAVYILPNGNFLRQEFSWDYKNKSQEDLKDDMQFFGNKLGVTYLYNEEKE